MALQLKKDDNGQPLMKDNKFVYVDDAGQDLELDPAHLYGRVRELTGQNAQFRQEKEGLEQKYKPFEGLDPEKAREAIQKLQDIDTKKLIDAGQVEAIRQQIRDAAKAENEAAQRAAAQQLADKDKAISELEGHLHRELIGGNFHRSEWVKKNVNVPIDMFMNTFQANFKVEEGKTWGYLNGQKMLDPSDFQSPAAFDACIEKMVEAYPFKDMILKGVNQSGSGADQSKGGPGAAAPKGNLGGSREERVAAIKASLPPELRG